MLPAEPYRKSNFSTHQSHLGSLVKFRCQGPNHRYSGSIGLGGVWKCVFLTHSQMVLMLLTWGCTLRTTGLNNWDIKLTHRTKSPQECSTRVRLTAQWYQVLDHVFTCYWPFPQDSEIAAISPSNLYLHQGSMQEKRGGWGKNCPFKSVGHMSLWPKLISKHPVRREGGFWVGDSLCLSSFPALSGQVNSRGPWDLSGRPSGLCSVGAFKDPESGQPLGWFWSWTHWRGWTSALFVIYRLDQSPVLV